MRLPRYGPETIEQIKLFDWIRSRNDIEPYAMHLANERKCSIQQGSLLKRMGVKSGVCDVFIAIPMGQYHGLWLELKANKNKPTPNQINFMKNMADKGYLSLWTTGYEGARKIIETYVDQNFSS